MLDGAFPTASGQSGVLYLELANDTGRVVRRRIMRVSEGLGAGHIAWDAKDTPEGSYTLRAYTNLMRQFNRLLIRV